MVRQKLISHSKLAKALVLMTVALVLALWNPAPLSGFFRGVLHTVVWPVEKAASFLAFEFSDAGEFLSSISELKRENERLKRENVRLLGENAKLTFLRGENDALRKEAGLKVRERFEFIAGEVIASGGEGQRGALIVDKGSASGIQVGMPVVVGDGVLVGVVEEVYPASAQVRLLTHSKSAIGGVTAEVGTKGIVRGERGVGMLFDMVLEKDVLRSGDRIVTSGSKDGLPSGLYIGIVENVHESPDKLFQQGSVISPVELNNLRFVFFINKERSK